MSLLEMFPVKALDNTDYMVVGCDRTLFKVDFVIKLEFTFKIKSLF